ncbi:cytochrome P450 302a1, mitochondrial [Trichonephila clavata]|uniref:Cytochrome P450 302a1, mitochondrial n=1 Tax=Trichonephila clavata TaxID=2740835 RepID=A0A8X6KIU7_TRICU|nr:cytochrome P450 302a1, mitochondrial [Trichonephila clavata]
MALLKTSRHCLELFPTGCRILSCCFSSRITVQPPYWHKIFPDKRIRNFDEMPTVGPVIEEYKNFKIHESYHRWVKDVGHVVKELFPDGSCCVHIYYKDDFKTVYQNDGGHPLRKSHGIIAKYRQDRPLIYGNVGLGPGLGAEWAGLRKMLPSGVGGKDYLPFRYDLEGITNDFIELILSKLDKNGEVELLPLLFRWAFESIGFVTLNRHLGSLRFDGQEEVNNLIEAAHLTNEIVFLSNVCDFEKQYERLVPIQDYFASKVIEYVQDTINLHLYGPCIVVNLSEAGFDVKLISTLIMDLFQGATATVPLTLTWALYHLSRCPDIQERAREELIERMPTKQSKYYKNIEGAMTGELLFDAGHASPHVQAILQETLRLSPPIVGNGRVSQMDLVLGGYMVPAGTMIVLQTQAACMLEDHFERPLEFLPDRFIHSKKYHRVGAVNLPFGFGARFCIGQPFAHGQLILALSKILRNFEVSYDGEEVGVINRLHNEPDKPVIFKLKPLKQ